MTRSSTSAPLSSSRPRPPPGLRTCESLPPFILLEMPALEDIRTSLTHTHPPPLSAFSIANRYMRIDRLASLEPLFIDVTWGAVRCCCSALLCCASVARASHTLHAYMPAGSINPPPRPPTDRAGAPRS